MHYHFSCNSRKDYIFQITDGPSKSHYEEEDKVESRWNSAGLQVFWTHAGDVARAATGFARSDASSPNSCFVSPGGDSSHAKPELSFADTSRSSLTA